MKIPLSVGDINQGKLSKISQALVRILRPNRTIKLSYANEATARILGYDSLHDAQKSAENVERGNFDGYHNLLFSSYPMPSLEDIHNAMHERLCEFTSESLSSESLLEQLPFKALDFMKRALLEIDVNDEYLRAVENVYFEMMEAVSDLPIEDDIQSEFHQITNPRDNFFLLFKDSTHDECKHILNKMKISDIFDLQISYTDGTGLNVESTFYKELFLPAHQNSVSCAIGFCPPPGLDDCMDVPADFYSKISKHLELLWTERNSHLSGKSLYLKKPDKYGLFEQWDYRRYFDKNKNYKRSKVGNFKTWSTSNCPSYEEAYNWSDCYDSKIGKTYSPLVLMTGNIFVSNEYSYDDMLESVWEDGTKSRELCGILSGSDHPDAIKLKSFCNKALGPGCLVTISNLEETVFSKPGDIKVAVEATIKKIKMKFGPNVYLAVYVAPPEYQEWVPHNDLSPIVQEKKKSITQRIKFLKSQIPKELVKSLIFVKPDNEDRTHPELIW